MARKKVTKQGDAKTMAKNVKKAAAKRKPSKRVLVPRPFGSGTLTAAGKHAKIVSALRGGSKWWKPKMECLNMACVGQRTNVKTGRLAKHFTCAHCNEVFPAKDVQVDHITPLVDPCGFTGWDGFIERLFCEVDGMQVLCKPCHQIKTNEEKAARSAFLKESKEKE